MPPEKIASLKDVGGPRVSLESKSETLEKYLQLKIPNKYVIVEYIWIDGTGINLRSKSQVLEATSTTQILPDWTFDGSSTGQATGKNSDVILHPVRAYEDPFRGSPHLLVLCETLKQDNTPHPSNHRYKCLQAMEAAKEEEPMFGLEQEYTMLDGYNLNLPLGWPALPQVPDPQGAYYCGVGAGKAFGRDIVEAHYRACLYAGVKIAGVNGEVAHSQWEFQIGPTIGIKAADDLWMARYLMNRIAEDFNVAITFAVRPLAGDWNGAGCHCNFSTREMREDGGLKVIEAAMPKLERTHRKHLARYDINGGKDNQQRLTGKFETSSMEKFTFGFADRSASCRIPRNVAIDGKGYLEDRRPASNCDPYDVTELLVRTICLNES